MPRSTQIMDNPNPQTKAGHQYQLPFCQVIENDQEVMLGQGIFQSTLHQETV